MTTEKKTIEETKKLLREVGDRNGPLVRGMANRLIEDIDKKGLTPTLEYLAFEFLLSYHTKD